MRLLGSFETAVLEEDLHTCVINCKIGRNDPH